MAKFSELEEVLVGGIKDDKLRDSLALIRQATESIWSSEVRVVRGYTDHGEQHCVRLVGYADQVLNANSQRPFSDVEMYLLLAGIYIHDLGMQCDLARFPEILQIAEKIGADFNGVTFTAKTANDYTITEQKEIRKHHHLISAAWLNYAYTTGKSALGTAAKTIPQDYLQDLVDVCIHHTKLPISDCKTTLYLGAPGRKQLVAAVLRFADELDIEASRVNIETVKNFNLEPENSVYWWLHHATTVSFVTTGVVLLKLALSSKDFNKYASHVREIFVTAFRTKNRPVIDVLKLNGLQISIDADSDVVSYDYAEDLPSAIVHALDDMRKPSEPSVSLANEIRIWLQAIRYEVTAVTRIDNRTVDMNATLEQGSLKQRVLIRCISDELQPGDVVRIMENLSIRNPQGWLISQTRISPTARKRAAEPEYRDNVSLFTLREFLTREVWAPYISSLTSQVENEQIPTGIDLYEDIGCYKAELDDFDTMKSQDNYSSLDEYIDGWLREHSKKHISLLGEFGTGKTWFCRHYAYRQLTRYLNDPFHERFPLLITLRSFAKAMTAQQLINDALLVQYQLPFVGNPYENFEEMNRNGKLLLLLDGFDEMARQVDQQALVSNFWELASLVDEQSKVILTSRTEYFRQGKESENILGGMALGSKTLHLASPKFEVVHLEGLRDEQIRHLIINRLKPDKGEQEAEKVADQILRTENLADMARKPILVELLLAALAEVSPDILQKPAQVYLYATNKLLLRNIETRRTFTTTADKLFFLCEIAWEMIRNKQLRIHFKDIPQRITLHFGDKIKDQHDLDAWDFDLRNQTLLHRNVGGSGYYEFAHKSLAEFFVALKFAAEIDCLPLSVRQTYMEADGKRCQFPIRAKAEMKEMEYTFGLRPLLAPDFSAVRQLLIELLSLVPDVSEKLFKLVYGTRTRSWEQAAIIGGNAFNLLRALGTNFQKSDLSRVRLYGVDFTSMDMTGVNFSEAQLDTCLYNNETLFVDGAFDQATIHSPRFRHTGPIQSSCRGVNIGTAFFGVEAVQFFALRGAVLSVPQKRELEKFQSNKPVRSSG